MTAQVYQELFNLWKPVMKQSDNEMIYSFLNKYNAKLMQNYYFLNSYIEIDI